MKSSTNKIRQKIKNHGKIFQWPISTTIKMTTKVATTTKRNRKISQSNIQK